MNNNYWFENFNYSWPTNQDIKPNDYLNKGGRVTAFTLTKETPLICAVEQLANYLENLNVKIVIKVDNHFLDDVTSAFEKTSIKDQVSFSSLIFFHLNYIAPFCLILNNSDDTSTIFFTAFIANMCHG
jgi:hypothetical protein